MPLPELSVVRLTTDDYVHQGVSRGAIGVIVHVFADAYLVEFSRPDGTTIAWFAVRPEDIEAAPEGTESLPARSTI